MLKENCLDLNECPQMMDLTSSAGDETRLSSDSRGQEARQSPDVRPCAPTSTFVASPTNLSLPSPSPAALNKIYSKNANGTVIMTSSPSNDAELQLYRVMQRASLLAYYDTLLEMGGDDVQQLCDAGEEEFLEIMALVGMASKPLHVRRFQKSLQEWMIDPSSFQVPLTSGNASFSGESSTSLSSSHLVCCTRRSILESNRPMYSPSPGTNAPNVNLESTQFSSGSPGLSLSKSSSRSSSPLDVPSCSSSSSVTLPLGAALLDSQIFRLRAAAERISKHLPQLEPKTHNAKRKVCKELELVMAMSEDDPRRMDEIRKYAAIYGRFDCKRKPEKPLTLHEVSVNEAAAQICHFVPALLTRRDELFPLARQVVRDSGYLYTNTISITSSKGIPQLGRRKSNDDDVEQEEEPPPKKAMISDKKNT